MTQHIDLLDRLAEIAPDSSLAEARKVRKAATVHAQGSYDALFNMADPGQFSRGARFQLAQQIAEWHQDAQLAAHYAAEASQQQATAHWQTALAHAERLTFKPALARADHLIDLQQAGWSQDDIVTLSQLIAFISFQSRLLRGLRLISNNKVENASDAPVAAAAWRTDKATHGGRTAPAKFTQQALNWEPWMAAKPLEAFNADEQATLARFGHSDSDYFRLLGRNLPLLEQRTLTDKGIFFTSGGLARQERELAATVASKVNGCIYCASVHARKASQLSKQPEDVQRLLDVAPGDILSQGQTSRWQAEIEFAAALSTTPSSASLAQIERLRALALSDIELLDLVQSTAFFAWANRLMLTLGEPYLAE